jgi:magnesium-transporting ATPase (P-type)
MLDGNSLETQEMILSGCAVNSNSHILVNKGVEQRVGNQTECAMLAFINKELKDNNRPEKSYEDIKNKQTLLKMFPFNSDTKKMTVVVELEHQKKVRVYTKGASENIIDDCAYIS